MAGYILMTAMPPSKGHEYLIRFADNFLCSQKSYFANVLNVIVCTQPHEPMRYERVAAITKLCHKMQQGNNSIINVEHYDKAIQQTPSSDDDPAFWQMWKNIFTKEFGFILTEADILFSSENYGFKLADVLGIKHIPVDIKRQVIPITGTSIRNRGPYCAFRNVIDEFKPYIQKTVTIFGAESTGKTTLSKALTWQKDDSKFIHEWARPYLESLSSPETTDERMSNIVNGQYAAMKAVSDLDKYQIIVRDTDLLSTIGYFRIYCPHYKKLDAYNRCVRLFGQTKADLYLLTKSNIPFEPDPLRYGGDKRESTDQFWIDLLREFNVKYEVIDGKTPHLRTYQANKEIEKLFANDIWGYQRE